MSIFQEVQDSEINFQISCFWDGGFTVRLGDELNGFYAHEDTNTFEEVEEALVCLCKEHQKDSKFVCDLEGREFKGYCTSDGQRFKTYKEYQEAQKKLVE